MELTFLKEDHQAELSLKIESGNPERRRSFTRKTGEIRQDYCSRGLLGSSLFAGALNSATREFMNDTATLMLDSLFLLASEEGVRIDRGKEPEIAAWVSSVLTPIWTEHVGKVKAEMTERGLRREVFRDFGKPGDDLIREICDVEVPRRCLEYSRSLARKKKEQRRASREKLTWKFVIPLTLAAFGASGLTAALIKGVTCNSANSGPTVPATGPGLSED